MYPLVKKPVSVANLHNEDHCMASYHLDYGTNLHTSIEGIYLRSHGVCIDRVTQLSTIVNDFTNLPIVKGWVPPDAEATALIVDDYLVTLTCADANWLKQLSSVGVCTVYYVR